MQVSEGELFPESWTTGLCLAGAGVLEPWPRSLAYACGGRPGLFFWL